MNNAHTAEEVYEAVRHISAMLKADGFEKPAAMLTHRMTKVAWSSKDELFEELLKVFGEARVEHGSAFSSSLLEKIQQAESCIQELL